MRLGLSVNGRPRPAFTLIELLAVILILGLLMALLGPSLAAALRQAYRGTCKTNLHELARGCISYAGEGTLHRGTTPFALPNSSSSSSTDENTTNWGSLTEGNTAALWVLVKYGYAGTSLFYCPEAGLDRGFDEPAKDGIGYPDTGVRTEFTPTTISYSYISMVDFAYATTTVEDESSLVILADQNPRCTLGVTGVQGSPSFNMAPNLSENSLNHEGDGQVIARRGGSVDWIESPTGDGDDIYGYAGTDPAIENEGRRQSRTDVIVIP